MWLVVGGWGVGGWQEEKWDLPTDHFTEAHSCLPRDKRESANKRLHHFYPWFPLPQGPLFQPLQASHLISCQGQSPHNLSRPHSLWLLPPSAPDPRSCLPWRFHLRDWTWVAHCNILHGWDGHMAAPSRPSSPYSPMSSYPSHSLITSKLTGNPASHIPPPSSPLCSPLFTPSDILPISLLRLLKVWPPH